MLVAEEAVKIRVLRRHSRMLAVSSGESQTPG